MTMTDSIRVRFLGEEREFKFSRDIDEGFVVYDTGVEGHRFTLTRYDGTGWGQKTGWSGGGLRGLNTALRETAQQAADELEKELRPLAMALAVLSVDLRKPDPLAAAAEDRADGVAVCHHRDGSAEAMSGAHHDCPACPSCDAPCAVPARTQEPGRWRGPANATLFCPACGTGWVGGAADVEQAERAQAAWSAIRTAEAMPIRGQA